MTARRTFMILCLIVVLGSAVFYIQFLRQPQRRVCFVSKGGVYTCASRFKNAQSSDKPTSQLDINDATSDGKEQEGSDVEEQSEQEQATTSVNQTGEPNPNGGSGASGEKEGETPVDTQSELARKYFVFGEGLMLVKAGDEGHIYIVPKNPAQMEQELLLEGLENVEQQQGDPAELTSSSSIAFRLLDERGSSVKLIHLSIAKGVNKKQELETLKEEERLKGDAANPTIWNSDEGWPDTIDYDRGVTLRYRVDKAGVFSILLAVNGDKLHFRSGQPYMLTVVPGPTDPSTSELSLQDRKETLVIQTRDRFSNKRIEGGDSWRVHFTGPSEFTAPVTDLENGRYEITFPRTDAGVYYVSCTLLLNDRGALFTLPEEFQTEPFVNASMWYTADLDALRPPCILKHVAESPMVLEIESTIGDPPKKPLCTTGLERGRWMDNATRWEPYTCDWKNYPRIDAITCLLNKRSIFVGNTFTHVLYNGMKEYFHLEELDTWLVWQEARNVFDLSVEDLETLHFNRYGVQARVEPETIERFKGALNDTLIAIGATDPKTRYLIFSTEFSDIAANHTFFAELVNATLEVLTTTQPQMRVILHSPIPLEPGTCWADSSLVSTEKHKHSWDAVKRLALPYTTPAADGGRSTVTLLDLWELFDGLADTHHDRMSRIHDQAHQVLLNLLCNDEKIER